MGKKSKMRNVKTKEVLNTSDFTKTQNFLNSAINDVSGWIKFLDTKVSIIMVALGVVISGIINCREIIYDTYQMLQVYSLLHIFFCVLVFMFAIATALVYFWGLQTIKAHRCNINFKSLWFIIEKKDDYPFEIYKEDIKKMTEKDVIDALAAELYKVNDIYRQKAVTMKRTIRVFGIALVVLFAIVCICVFLNVR
ncbi:MAG: hypothetical protein K1W37_18055 [Lachnospiraceae bacterium]|jgi:hypothetical protein